MAIKKWSSGSNGSPVTWDHIPPLTVLGVDLQVHLCVRPKVLIDISLQMDSQMWDAQNGPLHMYKPLLQPT